jgi:YbbR domain-containing protein
MKNWLAENWLLKLISLVLAVMLEVYFYSPDNSIEFDLSVPVRIDNLAVERMIVWPPSGDRGLFARVRLRAPAPLEEKIKSSELHFTIDVGKTEKPSAQFELLTDQLSLPSGVSVVQVEPSKIDLRFEKEVKKELLVVADQVGVPQDGYVVGTVKVFPETVGAWGPESELEGLNVIETRKVDVTGFNSDRRIEVPLAEKGPMTKLSAKTVFVSVEVAPIQSERIFENVSINALVPDGYAGTLEPPRLKQIKIAGPAGLLEKLAADQLVVIADSRERGDGKHKIAPEARLPDGLRVVEAVPAEVTINQIANRQSGGRTGKTPVIRETPDNGSKQPK